MVPPRPGLRLQRLQAVLREEEEMNMPTQAICFFWGVPWVSEDWFPGFPSILFDIFLEGTGNDMNLLLTNMNH